MGKIWKEVVILYLLVAVMIILVSQVVLALNVTDVSFYNEINRAGNGLGASCNVVFDGSEELFLYYNWTVDGVVKESGVLNNSVCYQESANVSDGCASSLGGYGISGTDAVLYPSFFINYSKSLDATNGSVWTVKHGDQPIYNQTIPFSCWNNSILQFRIYSLFSSGNSTTYCYDGSDWLALKSFVSPGCAGYGSYGYEARLIDGDYSTWTKGLIVGGVTLWSNANNGGGCVNASIFEESMQWEINNFSNSSNNSFVGVPFLDPINFEAGNLVTLSCKLGNLTVNGSVFVSEEISIFSVLGGFGDAVGVAGGGGTLAETLEAWNPSIYPLWIENFKELLGQTSLYQFGVDLWEAVVLTIKFILVQPASLGGGL